ncbi:hypothetical protein M011DRAFT_460886 [Sporormia fimetaria CBS 119925]|uniref:F-box domain-containing protein n=1 Tax=Sporormia fimetaria CBS 119925 TaxID=1340428 RepID=A0A6A6V391_9PLEO|nr:hypothetical protein M011DRAFT_460886 [Sporormia fimetaria CBS 119925]
MPKKPLGWTPSSAFLSRFLKGRKPGTGILPLLPTELVQLIAEDLTIDGLGNLRLTCKTLEAKLMWFFTDLYFKTIAFVPSRYGLQALAAISESRLGQCVEHLIFAHACYEGVEVLVYESTPAEDDIVDAMHAYATDNRRMRLTGEDVIMIRKAIRNLSNVRTLMFLDDFTPVYPRNARIHGYNYLYQKVGAGCVEFEDSVPIDVTNSMSRVFAIVLQAVQEADLKIEIVNASAGSEESFVCCPVEFPITPTAFSSLHVLRIPIANLQIIMGPVGRGLYLDRLESFLAQLPRLRIFGVSFGYQNGASDFIEHLIAREAVAEVPLLELQGFAICSHKLVDVLRSVHSSFKGLTLWNVCLVHGSWIDIVEGVIQRQGSLNWLDIRKGDELDEDLFVEVEEGMTAANKTALLALDRHSHY